MISLRGSWNAVPILNLILVTELPLCFVIRTLVLPNFISPSWRTLPRDSTHPMQHYTLLFPASSASLLYQRISNIQNSLTCVCMGQVLTPRAFPVSLKFTKRNSDFKVRMVWQLLPFTTRLSLFQKHPGGQFSHYCLEQLPTDSQQDGLDLRAADEHHIIPRKMLLTP